MPRLLFLLSALLPCPSPALEILPVPITSAARLELTREYCRAHYGLDTHSLAEPKIIVIHHTAIATLKASLNAFRADRLPGFRKELQGHGALNVGVHFVVDRNGRIYSLLPLNVIGRHAIGLNHVSLGIENVALAEKDLTKAQIDANAGLVQQLAKDLPSVEYLIGHHEYARPGLPHYRFFKDLDKSYRPTVKSDPGEKFMKSLRRRLAELGVVLKD